VMGKRMGIVMRCRLGTSYMMLMLNFLRPPRFDGKETATIP
jgi:hypothetical protein